MTDLSDITDYLETAHIDECWVAHKPWLRDKTHRYKAYIRWYVGTENERGIRPWTWRESFGSTAEEALTRLKEKME